MKNSATATIVNDDANPPTPTGPTPGPDDLAGGPEANRISLLAGNDYARGGDDNDRLSGNAGSDRLYGDAGRDSIDGGLSNDYLRGGDGSDTITGGTGNDQLYGDAGRDFLNGGEGADRYVFTPDPGGAISSAASRRRKAIGSTLVGRTTVGER